MFMTFLISSAELKVSCAEGQLSGADGITDLSVVRPCTVHQSTFSFNRYSSFSSYSIILNFLLEKLGI